MGLLTFNPTPSRDGSNVSSTVDPDWVITNLTSSDSYLDSTAKISEIAVYYQHTSELDGTTGERQKKRIRHFSPDNFHAQVNWSPIARDGTWEQVKVKVADHDDATSFYYVTKDFTSENLILP